MYTSSCGTGHFDGKSVMNTGEEQKTTCPTGMVSQPDGVFRVVQVK